MAKEVRDYEVEVKEVLSRIETIHAETFEDAIDKVMDKYHAQEIVLDAEDFVGVDFLPSEEEKNKTMKHLHSR
ncbi:MAG: DpnD/PcfM family protein [Alphaproteobacteria bacterium]|nr:DpnD/PcfM family protein [Alphaproteobacteria bacterium]